MTSSSLDTLEGVVAILPFCAKLNVENKKETRNAEVRSKQIM